jgi:hypothetical protein
VGGVELDRRFRGVDPLLSPVDVLVALRVLLDERAQPFDTNLDQDVRVGVALEHGEIGDAEVAGQRGHRQHLADQVLDPALVQRALQCQAVRRPHAAVQRRPLDAGQDQWLQAGGVEQRQPGQGVGIDPVGLGVPL